MSYFTNYTITTDCLLQFFYIVRHKPMDPGHGVPDPKEFPPQLRVHSFNIDYDSLQPSSNEIQVSTVLESGDVTPFEDPRFQASILFRRTDSEFVEAVVRINIEQKGAKDRVFLIRPDTSVPFMVNVYGSDNEEETAQTALVLHGVFKGGHRNNLLDAVIDIFRGLGRG
jgi:hypothetical protein